MERTNSKRINCPSCNAQVNGDFCSQCGEKRYKRLRFSEIMSDLMESILSLEAPFLRTIWGVLVSPSKLLNNYFSGSRKKYVKPVYFFFLILSADLYLNSQIGPTIFFDTNEKDAFLKEIETWFYNYKQPLIASITPIFAVAIFLFYRRSNSINYTEALVSALYCMSGFLMVDIFILIAFYLSDTGYNDIINSIITVAYTLFFLITFSKAKAGIALLQAIGTVIIGNIFVYIIFFVLMIILTIIHLL